MADGSSMPEGLSPAEGHITANKSSGIGGGEKAPASQDQAFGAPVNTEIQSTPKPAVVETPAPVQAETPAVSVTQAENSNLQKTGGENKDQSVSLEVPKKTLEELNAEYQRADKAYRDVEGSLREDMGRSLGKNEPYTNAERAMKDAELDYQVKRKYGGDEFEASPLAKELREKIKSLSDASSKIYDEVSAAVYGSPKGKIYDELGEIAKKAKEALETEKAKANPPTSAEQSSEVIRAPIESVRVQITQEIAAEVEAAPGSQSQVGQSSEAVVQAPAPTPEPTLATPGKISFKGKLRGIFGGRAKAVTSTQSETTTTN